MIKLNCPNCRKRTAFSEADKGKFECQRCNEKFNQCKRKECSNMVNHGFICKECVSKGLGNGGSLILSGLVIAGGIAFKVLRRK